MDNSMPDLDHHRLTQGVVVAATALASIACFFGVKHAIQIALDVAGACFVRYRPDNANFISSNSLAESTMQSLVSSPGKRRTKRKIKATRIHGISNLGQTCFANVVLQAQSSADEFVDFVRQLSVLSRGLRSKAGRIAESQDNHLLEKLDIAFHSKFHVEQCDLTGFL